MSLLTAPPPGTRNDVHAPEGALPWSGDAARLMRVPRARLGTWPTPVESWTDTVAGPVLIKRDDLSGWSRAGAKTRKLEHLIGHLLARGHDELITVAGNVTNLAFDMLPALDRHGIACTLYIQDDPPTPPTDRERIFAGVRPRVRLLGTSHAQTVRHAVAAYARSRARGRRPFLLLPGVSHPAGVIGNACGFLEMAEQRLADGEPLPHIVYVSAATGTTLAGFAVAEAALRRAGYPRIRVRGVQVYSGAVRLRTIALIRWTERFENLSARVAQSDVEIVSSELHGGFGHFPARLGDTCAEIALRGGPQIDPIFGGKAWAAMQREVRAGVATRGPVLYWHCGYTPEWQTLGDAVRRGTRSA